VLNATPDTLETPLAVSLPAGLERVVARCLEKQRDQRYADAAELAEALAPFGSEDARLSLSRVTGLSRTRNSTPTSMARGLPNDEPTMPVVVEPMPRKAASAAATSGVRKIVSGPTRRSGLELGAVATVAIVGSVIWLGLRESKPISAAAMPPAVTQTAPVQTAPAPAVPIQATTGVVEAPTARPTMAAATRVQPPAKPSPHKHVTPSAANAEPAPSPTVSSETKPSAAEASAGDLGSSTVIERLIEQRH
jgi:hypothetical protein